MIDGQFKHLCKCIDISKMPVAFFACDCAIFMVDDVEKSCGVFFYL
jgi:hypothetical protein